MAVVRVNDHPTVGPTDELVVVHRDFESKALIFFRCTSGAPVIAVRSGTSIEGLGSASNTTLSNLGQVTSVALPIGSDVRSRVTTVTVTGGVVEASIVSPSEFRSYLSVGTV